MMAPDAAFVTAARWAALAPEQRAGFAPLAPDFVVEILSPTDSLPEARAKMELWIADGVRLGWLIDPANRCVTIYRPERDAETLTGHDTVAGDDDVLPGFELDLTAVWP